MIYLNPAVLYDLCQLMNLYSFSMQHVFSLLLFIYLSQTLKRYNSTVFALLLLVLTLCRALCLSDLYPILKDYFFAHISCHHHNEVRLSRLQIILLTNNKESEVHLPCWRNKLCKWWCYWTNTGAEPEWLRDQHRFTFFCALDCCCDTTKQVTHGYYVTVFIVTV